MKRVENHLQRLSLSASPDDIAFADLVRDDLSFWAGVKEAGRWSRAWERIELPVKLAATAVGASGLAVGAFEIFNR